MSVDPCPLPQDRVQLSVFNDEYASNLDVTPGPGGKWSADILASYDDMGTIIPFKAGPIGLSASCTADATGQTSFVYASTLSTVTGSTGPTCSDALFIAVTGSDEHYNGDTNLTVSPTLEKVYDGFHAVYPADKTITTQVLNYPALSVGVLFEKLDGNIPNKARQLLKENLPKYLAGKDEGVTALYSAVAHSRATCPNQAIVLAGYSQGSMVVHQFEGEYAQTSGPNKDAIKATVLIADPMRVANSGVIDFGDAAGDSTGICKYIGAVASCNGDAAVKDIPKMYRKSTTSVCNEYDAVCDTPTMVSTFWPLGLESMYQTGSMVHTGYAADQATKLAGKRAARQVLGS